MILVIASTLVVALLLGAFAWSWHWRTHPDLFPDAANRVGLEMDASRPTMYVGITSPAEDITETVTIDSIAPRLVENTAGASFGFFLCSKGLATTDGEIGVVTPRGFERYCPDAIPVVRGTEFEPSELGTSTS